MLIERVYRFQSELPLYLLSAHTGAKVPTQEYWIMWIQNAWFITAEKLILW